jgi:hypothetical protein
MIGPVSGTGRAMMASLQQAIDKGMPPDQAVQYVKSMATQGVAPLTDLYAMMNQFQRLKQQQVQPPQTPPTIKDQLNILDQQQMQRDTTDRSGGLGGLGGPTSYAGEMDNQPMDRGLGAIDAGRMEYPQFAGGGVVALSEGGNFSNLSKDASEAGTNISEFFGDILRGFGGAAPGAEPFQSREMYALSNDPTLTDEKIIAAYRQAVAKNDPIANELRKILLNRNLGAVVEQTNRELAVNKPVSIDQRTLALGQQLGLKDKPPAATATPSADTGTQAPPPPVAAAPNPFAGLGEVSGDFSKSRDFLSQLSASKKSDADLTEEQQIEKLEALNKKYGIGKADEEYGKYLERREGEAGKQLAEDRRMALAQAGFAMAEAASRRGRERTGFLGAAAIGGTKGAQLIDKAVRENRALKDRLAESRMALAQSQEMRKAGNIKEGLALQRSAKKDYEATLAAIAQNEQNISELMTRERGMDRRTGAQIGAQREMSAAQLAAEEKRYATAAQTAREKLMLGLMQEAPLLIKGYDKMDPAQQGEALRALLSSLAGGGEEMTGLQDIMTKYGQPPR